MRHKSAIITLVLVFGLQIYFLAGSTFLVDEPVSYKERRRLRQFPDITMQTIANGTFQTGFEGFASDQIIDRNILLNTMLLVQNAVFFHLDDDGIITYKGHLIDLEQVLDEDSIDFAVRCFNRIIENNIEGTGCKVYFSIIPDKSYFIEDDKYLPMDYERFFDLAISKMDQAKYIDVASGLSLDDYFYTDPHMRQEKIMSHVAKMAEQMGVHLETDYDQIQALERFKGAYRGITEKESGRDDLNYLYTKDMDDFIVYDPMDPTVKIPLYETDLDGRVDPYDLFLQGNRGMIVIENPDAKTDKELVLFRDSFGSAAAPLLATGYKKVTLVDLRNISSYQVGNYIDFTDQDVLFLYSTSVLNHSSTLR